MNAKIQNNLLTHLKSPHITLCGNVDIELWKDFLEQEKTLRTELPDQVVLLLSSKGGDCYYARALYDRLRLLAADTKVDIIATGACMSAAVSPLWMAVPKVQRFVTPSTIVTIHQTQDHKDVPMHGAYSSRKTRFLELQSHLDWEERDLAWMMQLIAHGTGQSLNTVQRTAQNAKFMEAQEAVDFGFAQRIIEQGN